ncbi:MAG: hypothetical protein ABI467_19375 [Kofleriaceae bacterium]
MIQHFLFVKLEDPHVESREDFAEQLRAQLAEAGVAAKVGVPADASAAKWDLSIVIDAASLEAWHAQAATPGVVAIFDALEARAHVTKRWSFDVGTAADAD